MKKYILCLVLFLIAHLTFSQHQEFNKFNVETGVQIPLGNLSKKFAFSEEIGFYYRTKIAFDDVFNVGIKFNFPNKNTEFAYYATDSIYQTKLKDINITVLGKVDKQYDFKILNNSFVFEWTSGFGFSFLLFDDKEIVNKKPNWQTDENGEKTLNINSDAKSLTSVFISQGIGITRKKIGISANYNFTPYNWFSKRIEKSFGNSSLSFVLTYKI